MAPLIFSSFYFPVQGEDVITVSFDYKGNVRHEYAPQAQDINKHFCSQMLKRLLNAVGL